MADAIQDTNNTPELHSPFEQLREMDTDVKEWWNSRKLARVLDYDKYWYFGVSLPMHKLGLRKRAIMWASTS